MRNALNINTTIFANASWLGKDLVVVANDALSAHAQRGYVHAALRAGVCLEGVLKRMLQEWQKPEPSRATFGQLIGAVRETGRVPAALLDRLQEANAVRIRAAHEKSSPWEEVSEADSLLILHVLAMVVGWFGREGRPAPGGEAPAGGLRVFLSVGGAHRLDQAQFLELLRAEMRGLGVELCNIPGGNYSQDKPFDQVRDLIAACRAALVVGLERALVYTVFERHKAVRQDRRVPTAWNQIEGSIASALRKPILILREARLHQEGIFEARNHGHDIRDFDLRREARGLSPELRAFLASWVQHVRSLPPAER
jgi:hypothetical protein